MKSGKKQALIDRIASKLNDYMVQNRWHEFNQMVEMINGMPKTRYGGSFLIRKMEDPVLVSAFREASDKKSIFVDKNDLRKKYGLMMAISSPVFFPLLPDGLENYDFTYTLPLAFDSNREMIVGVFLKIYNHQNFPDNPKLSAIRYRLSRGFKIQMQSESYLIHPCKPENSKSPKYVDLSPGMMRNPAATQRLYFMNVNKTLPYYFQVFLRAKSVAAVPVIKASLPVPESFRSADRVKQEYKLSTNSAVEETHVRLQLRCPLSMTRIKEPIRWPTCKHLQCIDKSAWNSLNKSNRKKCPICERPFNEKPHYVDGFSKLILESTGEDVDEVSIDIESNLTWSIPSSRVPEICDDLESKLITLEDLTDLPSEPPNSPEELSLKKIRHVETLEDTDVRILNVKLSTRTGSSPFEPLEIS